MDTGSDPYAPTAPGTRPSPLPGADPGLAGRRVGEYEILRELGRGGMGVVYLARDLTLDRDVAVKVLQPHLSKDAEFEARFVREAKTAAKLDHPNIVQVYTAGRQGDVLYIAMQFVKGETLQDHLKRKGRLPAPEALRIIRQAAEALDAAHQAELVHRDIKPNNLMIDESGRVKIMDFGLMRSSLNRDAITEAGVFYGTPEYSSPEQCETTELDGRSDIYSLGAILYETLTGRVPHRADTPYSLFRKIREEEPAPPRSLNPDVPAPVEALLRKMMAKRREDRFGSAAELAEEIGRILEGKSAGPRVVRRGRRTFIVAAALAAAAAGLAVLLSGGEHAPPPPGGKIKFVVFDLRNGIPRPDTAWYEIALSDMLVAALGKHALFDVPTRDVLLWKLKEMKLGEKITEENRRVLTNEIGAHAYLSGTYYVQGGKIRLTFACYGLPRSSLLFPEMSVDKPEDQLFALVDEVAGAVARGMKKAGPTPPSLPRPSAPAVEAPAAPPAPAAAAPAPAKPSPVAEETKLAAGRKEAQEDKPRAAKREALAKDDLFDARRRHGPSAGPEIERLKAWYENRQALERGRGGKEEFEAAAESLREQVYGSEGAEAGVAQQQRKAAPLPFEFACGPCNRTSSSFGRCPDCRKYMVVRLKPKK